MKEDLENIFQHYGYRNQLRQFNEETEEITNLFWSKAARILQRIESGYYERNNE